MACKVCVPVVGTVTVNEAEVPETRETDPWVEPSSDKVTEPVGTADTAKVAVRLTVT